MLCVGVACALLACVDQRKIWAVARRLADSHPEADRPGEAHFVLSRMSLVVGALLAFGVAVWFLGAPDEPADADASAGEVAMSRNSPWH